MTMRALLATLLLLALTACGNGPGGTQYGSAKDVATALGCTAYKTASPELWAADAGSCTYAGHTTGIQWFKDTDSRNSWVDSPDFGTINLAGTNWAIECDSKPDCAAIQKVMGGTIS